MIKVSHYNFKCIKHNHAPCVVESWVEGNPVAKNEMHTCFSPSLKINAAHPNPLAPSEDQVLGVNRTFSFYTSVAPSGCIHSFYERLLFPSGHMF